MQEDEDLVPGAQEPQRKVDEFIQRWAKSSGERGNAEMFLVELCALLGVEPPEPKESDTSSNSYVLEKSVSLPVGGNKNRTLKADLYRKGCFVLEAKNKLEKRGKSSWKREMIQALEQGVRYANALSRQDGERVPFVMVLDVGHCIDLYVNFSPTSEQYPAFHLPADMMRTIFKDASARGIQGRVNVPRHRLMLTDLFVQEVRELLVDIWTQPHQRNPAKYAEDVTQKVSKILAEVARDLEKTERPVVVAHFLQACLFAMFAEDVGLLKEGSFTQLLITHQKHPRKLRGYLEGFFRDMDKGGFSTAIDDDVRHFNGGLFKDVQVPELTSKHAGLLSEAAKKNWADVEPAIFGTLLERALDPQERHKLGAHFTSREHVERLVVPTIIEPLQSEWRATQTVAVYEAKLKNPRGAREHVEAFLRKLAGLRVLDPACGSGNFLYVAMELLKRLERQVLDFLHDLHDQEGSQLGMGIEGTAVSLQQFIGIEKNPRAREIAELVMWIGYLQWQIRNHGVDRIKDPVLKKIEFIEYRDAVLDSEGNIPTWPEADFIIGNPPFIGAGRMREALGSQYTKVLRKAHKTVPNSCDLVMHWWDMAARLVALGKVQRCGLITTNSITQKFSRRVVQRHLDNGVSIVFAIPDHPWSDEGADVRVAMTVIEKGEGLPGVLHQVCKEESLLGKTTVEFARASGVINANLTIGVDVSTAQKLQSNDSICSPGVKLHGKAFKITKSKANKLGLNRQEKLGDYIVDYMHGNDLNGRSRELMLIDLFGLDVDEVRKRYPETYEYLLHNVKPEREAGYQRSGTKDSQKYAELWWLLGKPRPVLRAALKDLSRYISTVETSKHRFFVFINSSTRPDNKLINWGLDDAYFLGVLSSRIHTTWSDAAGGRLGVGNDPVYSKSTCFDTFPFPACTEQQKETIRALAEDLDELRWRQLQQHKELTLTSMYNVLAMVRERKSLTSKDKAIYEMSLMGTLKQLHDQLDEAVAEAYGWPADLGQAQILEKLLELNRLRAQEEEGGLIRYLRPQFQDPEYEQRKAVQLNVPGSSTADKDKGGRLMWPANDYVKQALFVHNLLLQQVEPVTVEQLAEQVKGVGTKRLKPWLDALEGLGQVYCEDGMYVA